MASVSKEHFLEAVHGDRELQHALGRSELLACALRIARAAGMEVSAAELVVPLPGGSCQEVNPGGATAEGDGVDFDGDGVPDAVLLGGRWVMQESEE